MAERMAQQPVWRVHWKTASGKVGYTAIPAGQAKTAAEAKRVWEREHQDTGQTFVKVQRKAGDVKKPKRFIVYYQPNGSAQVQNMTVRAENGEQARSAAREEMQPNGGKIVKVVVSGNRSTTWKKA